MLDGGYLYLHLEIIGAVVTETQRGTAWNTATISDSILVFPPLTPATAVGTQLEGIIGVFRTAVAGQQRISCLSLSLCTLPSPFDCVSILFYSSMCPSAAGSCRPPLESSNFLYPLLSLSMPFPDIFPTTFWSSNPSYTLCLSLCASNGPYIVFRSGGVSSTFPFCAGYVFNYVCHSLPNDCAMVLSFYLTCSIFLFMARRVISGFFTNAFVRDHI